MQWKVDERVRHETRPDWGLGKVLEVSPGEKLLVQFLFGGERLLKMAPLVKVTGPEAEWPAAVRRAKAPSALKPRRSIEEYKAAFVQQFPEGFSDAAYVAKERQYKVDAGAMLQQTLGREAFQALRDEGDHDEVCKRALAVVGATNLIFPNEKMALRDGLVTDELRARFSAALFELIHGEADYEDRFNAFVLVLEAAGASKWTIATYFSFIAEPEAHLFVKPEGTKRIADACAMPLNYRAQPNWLTYECAQRLAQKLMDVLVDLKPRDRIDVQSFIWIVAR